MIMTIYIILHSVLYKKKKHLTGYIQYYKKMVGQTQSPWVRQNPSSCLTQNQTEKVFANSVIPNVWYNSHLRFCPKGIDQCLILFLNYIIFIVFTPFIHFRFQPNPFVKMITTRLVICIYISQWHDVFHTTINL
jgi:hypothetical protein